jgi:hypothetical protein
MKTSLKTRTVAFVASILVTTTTAHLIASYALPEQPNTLLAVTADSRDRNFEVAPGRRPW